MITKNLDDFKSNIGYLHDTVTKILKIVIGKKLIIMYNII